MRINELRNMLTKLQCEHGNIEILCIDKSWEDPLVTPIFGVIHCRHPYDHPMEPLPDVVAIILDNQ